MSPTPITPEHGQRLLTWLDRTARLATLPNAQLADLLVEQVWADLPLSSPQADVVAEAIERLRRTAEEGA